MKQSTKDKFMKFKDYLLDIIYPRHIKCIFCGEELDNRSLHDTCTSCLHSLPFITRACTKCGSALSENNTGVCANCKSNNFDFDKAKSVFEYRDEVVALVHKYKYSSMKFLAEAMSGFMCDILSTWDIEPDIITSVPLHKNREKDRRYNQSKLLAINIADKFKLPYVDLCEKIVDNPSQTTLDVMDRKNNVKDAYKVLLDRKENIKNKTILVIDDIYTTGSTSSEIARILKNVKADKVYILTFAHGDGDKVR